MNKENPNLATEYEMKLKALPEPLKSQILFGGDISQSTPVSPMTSRVYQAQQPSTGILTMFGRRLKAILFCHGVT